MHCAKPGCCQQSGVVSAIAVVLLASVVMLVLLFTVRTSSNGINDALNQSDNVAALFLAESGLEYAIQRLHAATASCDATLAATVSGIGAGGFSVQSGLTTDYDGATALPSTQCRVRVTGTVTASNISRTIQAIVTSGSGGGAIALDNSDSRDRNHQSSLSWNFTTAGTDRLLLVGVSLRRDNNQLVSSVSYGGAAMTYLGAVNNDPYVRVELWYLIAPALGSNSLSVNLNATGRFVVGVASFNAVDQTSPLQLPASFNSGQSIFPYVQLTTASDNAWAVAVLGAESNSGQILGFNQTSLWNNPSPGNPRIQGAGAYHGPVSPPSTITLWWLRGNDPWSIGAVVLQPATGGAGLLSWREVVQ
jgi:hypothetical protein